MERINKILVLVDRMKRFLNHKFLEYLEHTNLIGIMNRILGKPLIKLQPQDELINISQHRHTYRKMHKLFRFFFYESARYYSLEPTFSNTPIHKTDLRKYIYNFYPDVKSNDYNNIYAINASRIFKKKKK